MGCMTSKRIRILVLLGSARMQSSNKAILNEIQGFSFDGASEVILSVPALDQLPIFNEDQQHKNPISQEVSNLRRSVRESAGLLIITPEINGSLSPLILNALIWLSRSYSQLDNCPLDNKKAAVASASFLSQNQIEDCMEIGRQLNMRFLQAEFHMFLGEKTINKQGKIVSSVEKERLEKWYKKFIKYLKTKQ